MSNLPEGNEKSVITRLVNKIVSGDFEDLTVRELLFELRDYSDKKSLFRELAHFIAHPERDQGKFVEYIISYSQEIKFIWEFMYHKKPFDLHKPFPIYILDCIYKKIDKIDKTELQNKFNFTPHKLKKEINKHIIKDKNTNTAYLMNSAAPELYNVIFYCLSKFGIQKEILDQDVIINDIIKTLKSNDILFNENEFKKMSNKIMLCILLLLHLKTLQVDKNSNEELPYCSILFDQIGNKRKELYLGLYGILNSPEYDTIKITFPIISTNLLLTEYCDNQLLKDIMNSHHNNEITCPLEFNNFKLSYSSKSKKNIKNAIIFIIRDRGNGKLRLQILSLKDSWKHKTL
jgi:hypothetical protein